MQLQYIISDSLTETLVMLFRAARQWWTNSNRPALLEAQQKLLKQFVRQSPIVKVNNNKSQTFSPLNSIEFVTTNNNHCINNSSSISSSNNNNNNNKKPTVVLCHGFGSGLGFFFNNIDGLITSNNIDRLLLVDWLGMGGSDRPPCHRPVRGYFQSSSWCDSRFSPNQAVDFFVDPLEEWMKSEQLHNNVILVGHSLGGYLAARYALKYPHRLSKLVLASPVGIPIKPENALTSHQMPTPIRIIDALWWANVTPQQLIRMMGSTRGRLNVKRALAGRIPNLTQQQIHVLAEYLYQITVAHPSGEYAMNSLLEPAVSPDLMGVFAREPLEQRLQTLDPNIQLKIMFGDHDWMRPNESSARRLIHSLGDKRASLHIIENAGHHLYLENPTAFNHEIMN